MRLVGRETSVPSEHCSNGEHSQVCVVSPERGRVLRLGGSLAASPTEPPSHSGGCHFPATALYVTLSESDPHCHRLYVCPEDDCMGWYVRASVPSAKARILHCFSASLVVVSCSCPPWWLT